MLSPESRRLLRKYWWVIALLLLAIAGIVGVAAHHNFDGKELLRLQDRQSGKTLLLRGPVDGDALLSAIDLLAAGGTDAPSTKEMPAEPIGDMPR